MMLPIRILLASLASSLVGASMPADRAELSGFLDRLQSGFVENPSSLSRYFDGAALADTANYLNSLTRSDPGRSRIEPRIVSYDPRSGQAIVLLGGDFAGPNSGDATTRSLAYTGLYELRRSPEGWRVTRRIALGDDRISRQALTVTVDPSIGLAISADLQIEAIGNDGFAVGLNRAVRISRLLVDGRPADYAFEAGLLWVRTDPGRHGLRIVYDLPVEHPEGGGNSSAFQPQAGHVRNQYWWHPFFGFAAANGAAEFDVTVHIPQRYHVALDIPQSETVEDGIRTVRGRTAQPAVALTLAYDDAWTPRRLQAGGLALNMFTGPDYEPSDTDVRVAAQQLWDTLSPRFGRPGFDSAAIVQARARRGNGWHFLSNRAIFTGTNGGTPSRFLQFVPRVYLGHELAHLWFTAIGPGRNFLNEGWATFAESLVIRSAAGEEIERRFWQDQERSFIQRPELLQISLLRDEANSDASYAKGAWVFRMLENLVGQEGFDAAIRRYVETPYARRNIEAFIGAFGASAPQVRRFLPPWLDETGAVNLSADWSGQAVVLIQQGTVYWLPALEVLAEYRDGHVQLLRLDVDQARTVLPLLTREIASLRIDLDNRYLFQSPRRLRAAN